MLNNITVYDFGGNIYQCAKKQNMNVYELKQQLQAFHLISTRNKLIEGTMQLILRKIKGIHPEENNLKTIVMLF